MVLAFSALLLLSEGAAAAENWHRSGTLVCSDCHTIHNSETVNGVQSPMRYDARSTPARHLLRHESSLTLCVYCHDGSNAAAPNVMGPAQQIDPSAGGAFGTIGLPHTGHDLGTAAAVTPPDGTVSTVLVCTSCHDPHGSASYRNLKLDPAGRGEAWPVGLQKNPPAPAPPPTGLARYLTQNVIYSTGLSGWCKSCHDRYDQSSGHRTDADIKGSWSTDFAYWSLPKTNRVPVQNPVDAVMPSNDDQVSCVSCHKAHGSMNPFAQLYADGATLDSTCNQCHNM